METDRRPAKADHAVHESERKHHGEDGEEAKQREEQAREPEKLDWLIALMVWMLPGAETSKVSVIVIMTWIIGVAGFAHVIAGGTEVFYAAIRGEASWAEVVAGFIVPTLVGNVFGGVTLVAGLNHAQAEG
jgi:hypothetical protein